MPKDIKEILKSATKDLLTEESLTQIETLFNESINKKVSDKATLQVESALVKQDEQHAHQLQTLLEKIDVDHSGKLEKIVSAINESHTRKLKSIISRFQNASTKEAKVFKESLINTVSNYLELYLEKAVPMETIKEAVKVKKANKLINELRRTLGVDLAFSQEVIKEGVIDGKERIATAGKQNEQLIKENNNLKARTIKAEATVLLETLTSGLPSEKKSYIVKILGNKDTGFINENFNYTLSLFDKDQELIMDDLKKTAEPITKNVDRPTNKDSDLITENANEPVLDAQTSTYLTELKKY
jgi:hypothetical protein